MLQTMAFALSQVMPAAVDTGLFVSYCQINSPDGVVGASGAPSGTYSYFLGPISCMDAVPSEIRISARDQRAMPQIETQGLRHVLLSGYYYPQIFPLIQAGLQAVITDPDGTSTTYNLDGCEPDSQKTQTRLSLKVIAV